MSCFANDSSLLFFALRVLFSSDVFHVISKGSEPERLSTRLLIPRLPAHIEVPRHCTNSYMYIVI